MKLEDLMMYTIVVVAIILILVGVCYNGGQTGKGGPQIKFLGKQSCPYTREMQEVLKQYKNVMYVEVTTEEVPAVPYFINEENGKTAVGSMSEQEFKASLY